LLGMKAMYYLMGWRCFPQRGSASLSLKHCGMPESKQRDFQQRWKPIRSHYRLKRTFIYRLAVVVGICCAVQLIQLHVQARRSLEAKFTTTQFEDDAEVSSRYNNISSTFDRDELLAARPDWRLLGSGCEGSAFTWNGLVIKTYKTTRSRFRNCFASSLVGDLILKNDENLRYPTRWPTEIPATLLVGSELGFFTSTRRVLRESVPVGGSSMASRDTPRGGRNAAVTRKTGVARCSGGRFIHTKPGQPISPQIQRHASGNSKLARARPLSRRHQTGQYICRHVNGCRRRWSLDHRRSGQRPSHITSIPYLKSVDAEQQPATRLSGQ